MGAFRHFSGDAFVSVTSKPFFESGQLDQPSLHDEKGQGCHGEAAHFWLANLASRM